MTAALYRDPVTGDLVPMPVPAHVHAAAGLPVGLVLPYAGAAAPAGWLVCDGELLDVDLFPELAAVLGDTYGAPGECRLPNLTGRAPFGVGGAVGELGAVGGAAGHTHTTPAATAAAAGAHAHTVNTVNGNTGSGGGHSHASTAGSGGAHTHTASGNTAASTVIGSDGAGYRAQDSGHTHAVASGGAHTHAMTNPAAAAHTHTFSIVNAGMSQAAAHTHAVPAGTTGAGALPPFVGLLFIINAS